MADFKVLFLLLCTCGFFSPLLGQSLSLSAISGYVYNDSTGAPVEDVNVFISGTILGASTNKKGFFEINHVPPGSHELVASMVGYDTDTKSLFINRDQIKTVTFRIIPVLYNLPVVEIVAERPKEWLKNLKQFQELLLGNSEFASQCEIRNSHLLNLEWDDHVFSARIAQPLEIDNYALGYHIRLVLTSFLWYKNEGKLRYIYRSRFSLMKAENDLQEETWSKNREAAYQGSLMHFLRLLKEDNLEENGFSVYAVKEIDQRNITRAANFINNPRDYLLKPTLNEGEDIIKFNHFLKIIYTGKKVISEQDFQGNLIRMEKPAVSWVRLLVKEVIIDRYGFPDGVHTFETFGYWSQLGVANMLPKYYVPFN